MADAANAGQIKVQVCYALPERAFLRSLDVDAGTTVQQAIALCGLLQEYPAIDLSVHVVGIFGKKKTLATLLRDNDRVEVYRPLLADPKEARRRRAGNKNA